MKLLEKIKAKTSQKNRIKGQLATIGLIASTVLTLGVITNPIGITVLTVVGVLCGVKARHHALKTV